MNSRRKGLTGTAVATVLLALPAVSSGQAVFEWRVVTDNTREIPGFAGRMLNSYNDPSVNSQGLVVFRARSTGKQGGPIRGIFAREMAEGRPLYNVYLAQAVVPWPNNAAYNGAEGRFNEFPSFARVDAGSPTIVTRGQTQPTWAYEVHGNETRLGTSGIYVEFRGAQRTAMTQLGAVPGFEYYAVPGAPLYTRFEQFPGAPTVMDRDTVAFKGNFSIGEQGCTGVYFRNFRRGGGMAPVTLVASSYTTDIPGHRGTRFGSTAPPSATDGTMVFVGLDNEDAPTKGGIYRASLKSPTQLETLVRIGSPVPGEKGARFNRFGESLAVGDQARFVAFWGAWGKATRLRTVSCPTEGSKERRAYCNDVVCPGGTCVLEVPAYEGIFVYDSKLKAIVPVAKSGADASETFLSCKFSGRAPGASSGCGGGNDFDNDEDGELARWRCGAYVTLANRGAAWYQVAFKKAWVDHDSGATLKTRLALWDSRPGKPLMTVLDTGMDAAVLDPAMAGMEITGIGVERDSFRKGWMAIMASMAAPAEVAAAADDGHSEEAGGNAGIYLTRVPGWSDMDE